MSVPIVLKMKVLRHSDYLGPAKVLGADEMNQDESDKHYFDGSFDGMDNDQELMLKPNKETKNNWAILLRWIFYGFLLCTVLTTSYFLISDLSNPSFKLAEENYGLPLKDAFDGRAGDLSECSSANGDFGKFDCFPQESNANEIECLERGCCWQPLEANSAAPWCHYKQHFSYYTWSEFNSTPFGLTGFAHIKNSVPQPYPNPVGTLQVDVFFETENAVRIKVFDPTSKRFEVPLNYQPPEVKAENTNYEIKTTDSGIMVVRKGGFRPVFSTLSTPLVFTDQFLELTSNLNTEFVYGIGEVVDTLKRSSNWSRSVLFNHDTVPTENKNLYSSHPFALAVSPYNGEAHGVFLANSNAMEVILQKQYGSVAATFRTIGGILDFRIFLGPRPADVISQYTDVIGKPMLPPYWSLGFHLCRFNYASLNHTAQILDQNIAAGIPVDVQWNDLDYMQNRNDFTYDPAKFKGLPEFVKSLHARGMRYVPLIDPGVSASESPGSYSPYDDGIVSDIFIKNHEGKVFVGKVWNRETTVWPDFSHPNVTHYWMTQLDNFRKEIDIDGAWIDMNDPSNFLNGEKDGCPANSKLDHPPYVPHIDGGVLYFKTVCMSAQQYGGRHYDLHNLYGLQETIATYKALGDITSQRPFVISRSSYPGQGHYGGSWTGDVYSSWNDLKKSIPAILSYGLFGIPMVGADICGFNGNTTKDLCKRWQQLGAFYPFMRNHNTDDGIPQDPASLGQEVIDAAKETLSVRYRLLPYLYTLFFHAHITGEPVARPMFYEFYDDVNSLSIEDQFMFGPSILVAPILTPDFKEDHLTIYLPKGYWYSYYFQNIVHDSFGESYSALIPNNSIPLYCRGGSIIVTQEPGQTTEKSRTSKFEITAFLSKEANASGLLFWDDGVSNAAYSSGTYNKFSLTASNNDLHMTVDHWGYPEAKMYLGNVQVRGIRGNVTSVVLNNVDFQFSYNSDVNILRLDNLNLLLDEGFTLKWTTGRYVR